MPLDKHDAKVIGWDSDHSLGEWVVNPLSLMPSPEAVIIATAAVLAGAIVQGSLGFGMGLVSIPILALFVPNQLPQALVLASLPHTVLMLRRERDGLEAKKMSWLVLGRILGVAPGVVILTLVSARHLQILFAITTLGTAVAMAVKNVNVRISVSSQLVAGSISGLVGTAAGLGGPPVALLYANEPGGPLRSSLSSILLIGNTFAVLGYWIGGRLTARDLALAAVLLVPIMLGLRLGFAVRGRLEGPMLRGAVLLLVSASSMVLLASAWES